MGSRGVATQSRNWTVLWSVSKFVNTDNDSMKPMTYSVWILNQVTCSRELPRGKISFWGGWRLFGSQKQPYLWFIDLFLLNCSKILILLNNENWWFAREYHEVRTPQSNGKAKAVRKTCCQRDQWKWGLHTRTLYEWHNATHIKRRFNWGLCSIDCVWTGGGKVCSLCGGIIAKTKILSTRGEIRHATWCELLNCQSRHSNRHASPHQIKQKSQEDRSSWLWPGSIITDFSFLVDPKGKEVRRDDGACDHNDKIGTACFRW